MFLLDGRIIASASDLTVASQCEFALVRAVDAVLGRVAAPEPVDDPMLAYTARLGDEHEAAVLRSYVDQFGPWDAERGRGVCEIDPPTVHDRVSLEKARDETLDALSKGADVVFQASFFDGTFHGRADFLVRDGDRYAVVDSKLARRAKVQALLQVAAYADQLGACDVPLVPEGRLILGDRSEAEFPLADVLPVYRERRDRLAVTVAERVADAGAVRWGDLRYPACGRCPVCQEEIAVHRDVLGVARLGVGHQLRLRAAGIATIDELAASTRPVEGIAERVLGGLRTQARLQVRQDPPDGGPGQAGWEVVDPEVLTALPPADPGDLFFDFEGDPLWSGDAPGDVGIEYLFGVVEAPDGIQQSYAEPAALYRYWWADDRPQEKEALIAFLDYVEKRRARHPNMHIYHYAAYEKTALLTLTGRHGVGEETVDSLLRAGVLVDLYAAVRAGVRVSQSSYSIKKLEPFYMGDELRESDVTSGGASVVAYDTYTRLRARGDEQGAAQLRAELLDYNRYDCVSTLRLRDWLRSMVPSSAPAPLVPLPAPSPEDEHSDLSVPPFEQRLIDTLMDAAGSRHGRDGNRQAAAMLAAAIGYHRREVKPFWWAHYDRLSSPTDEWSGGRDVFVIEAGRVVEPWHRGPRQRVERRHLDLTGTLAVGSSLGSGASVFGVYDPPLPRGWEPKPGTVRVAIDGITVAGSDIDAAGHDVVRVEQLVRDGLADHPALPIALTPKPPPRTTSIHGAIVGIAEQVVDALDRGGALSDALPSSAGTDLLRRIPPRVSSGRLPAVVDGDDAEAITNALLDLEDSYVAVQGPPGTGKTHIGAQVIARLVAEYGWRIGVVAQSHAAIENMLDAVVRAGALATQVGKKPNAATGLWTPIKDTDMSAFLEAHGRDGAVLGGTMWDLTHPNRVLPGSLDLVVVDEAGQYSLANTLAVSTAGRRLLLLGDPQQLPQVSQGTHPEPVDDSALGWLTEGHGTLPDRYGYFLRRTWRMHSTLTAKVSRLAYDGRLESTTEVTDQRSLEATPAGVHVVTVAHRGNSVQSEEEAAEVVAQVRAHLGTAWYDPTESPHHGSETLGGPPGRPLGPSDIMVVAPYNAQVGLIRHRLRDAGLVDVPVGTVDRFQGRQAPVVIMSMTASSGADVPRGSAFLFSRNRLNVAVSRGQWRAILIRSDILTEVMPHTPEQLTELGAFIALCDDVSAS